MTKLSPTLKDSLAWIKIALPGEYTLKKINALPPFSASVLEPGFDLSVGHFEGFGKSGPLGRRQVFLAVEALLQLADLQSCK